MSMRPEGGLAFMAIPLRKHGRVPERPKKLDFCSLIVGFIFWYGQRAPRPSATFLEQIALYK